ncbi:serine/threonine-protein kinase D6PK [Lactuca sativa]|uniref:serine/threonine-protein kinase D6PK n=1 Tax=Lactuca sativa TaxID=4236 RepID=UPI000CB8F4C2|nr:serine/threonine-protein kinase D6PK [Lactuca sativa]
MEPPSVDDLADDLRSISFNSTTTTTATDINRSTSSGSETTWTTATSSARHNIHLPCNTATKPHAPSGDSCWDAVRQSGPESDGKLTLADIRFLHRLGAGDIGSVYLAKLKCSPSPPSSAIFAAKVMDKRELASRNKEGRSKTEREILEILDHPFLPTLYASLDSPKWSCLLTDFCPGGDLHVLRQRQPCKRFPESAVRFYVSEVIVALEYLHMLGIVYRDLKPENVLVRSDGHIMLTDFDLSLKCDLSTSTPAQVFSDHHHLNPPSTTDHRPLNPPKFTTSSCILPNCIVPAVSCFTPKRKRKKKPASHHGPEFVAEPVDVRSMSFVGTHEYLAPEIVSGEGHGSAVDWWTLGIFIFELFYGVTPFRGVDNELTLANIVARALEFPKQPVIPATARDLISQLLVKDPGCRMGSTMGASVVKHHQFFSGVNWALLRCTTPPFVPPPFDYQEVVDDGCPGTPVEYY